MIRVFAGVLKRWRPVATQAFPDEVVGQNQPRLAHDRKGNVDVGCASHLAGVRGQQHALSLDLAQNATKTPPAFDGHVEGELYLMPLPADKIRNAHQRAIDPRRGHLQIIGLVDGVGDIEDGRDSARGGLAIINGKNTIRRSAMIWTVQPLTARIFTRTRR